MRNIICLIMGLILIAGCDNADTSSAIKGGKGGPNKPIDSISQRFFLAHSALTELVENIDVMSSSGATPNRCIQKLPKNLNWNCRRQDTANIERIGSLEYQGTLPNLHYTNGEMPVASSILSGSLLIQGLQKLKMDMANSFFQAEASLDYQIRNSGLTSSYEMTWNLKGRLGIKGEEGLYPLENLDLLLTVVRKSQKGGKGSQPEVRFQYQIYADKTVFVDTCGRLKGQVHFLGSAQGPQLIESDPMIGLKPADGGAKTAWPSCGQGLQGLRQSAPNWVHPEP